MNNALSDIGVTIIQPLFTLALVLIATRFLAQLCGVSSYNPISMALRRITDPVVLPLGRLLPGGKRVNPGSLLALVLCQMLFIALMFSLIGRLDAFSFIQAAIWSLIGGASLIINIVFYSVIATIVVSFLAPQSAHPAVEFVWQLTEPVMAPLRQLLPSMGGLDFSPIILFIALNVVRVSLGHMAAAASLPQFVIGI
ncbi:MAG TPA: YggT family protein [Halieaceae bacterium]|jgi:YggT family protein|nr:YggT family protein [Pseudomonadales bacterium]MBL6823060.1 YggT family protein [Luminiphilus sp.]MDA0890695.1 YggT family protein [Pseudomonadota bacterium]RCL47207.1 MAG: YggT family protein [Halieaceae bacterium]RPH09297.1 MAG: YggT family protein [Alteromonadaceae bacterium TMED101]|tara:strand:+ start:386 stop:976 length:591 start_codon:yes stop_codon:yes gene_type:complete